MKYLIALIMMLAFVSSPASADCGKIASDAGPPPLYEYAEHAAMLVVLVREVNCDGTWLQQCEFGEDAIARDFEDVTPGL